MESNFKKKMLTLEKKRCILISNKFERRKNRWLDLHGGGQTNLQNNLNYVNQVLSFKNRLIIFLCI